MANGTQTVEDLGKLVKSKHPQYAGLSDIEVGQKTKAKYPQYSQFMDMPVGAEKTGLPGVQPRPLPKALDPTYKQPYSFVNPPEGMIRSGLREATYGAAEGDPWRAVRGGLKAATPAMIGATAGEFAAAPLTILARGAIGMGAGEAARWGAHKLGAGETASDVLGIAAGLLAMRGVPKEETLRKLWRFRDIPEVQDAAMKVFTGWKSKLLPGRNKAAVDELENALRTAETGPVTPMKPGKGTGTKFGGPTKPEYVVGRNVPRKGLPEPSAAPPGKGTGTPYGGPAEVEYSQPGKPIPRAVPRETPTVTPTKPGGGTGTKYGGPTEPEYSSPRASRPMPKKGPLLTKRASEKGIQEPEPEETELEDQLKKSIIRNWKMRRRMPNR